MTEKLFDILTIEELRAVKGNHHFRNVRIKDMTLEELHDLFKVFWPVSKLPNLMDVMYELKRRKAL